MQTPLKIILALPVFFLIFLTASPLPLLRTALVRVLRTSP